MSSANTLPPPPDTSLDSSVSSVPTSTKDKIGGVLSSVLRAAGGNTSPLDMELQKHYQARMDEAKMNQDHARTYATILATGTDPTTGQPLTPEARQQYQSRYDLSMAAYQKAAGVNKQTKQMTDKHKMLADHAISGAGGGGQAPGGQGAQPGQPANPNTMPPPPPTQGGAPPAAASGGPAGGAAAASQPSQPATPPGIPSMPISELQREMAVNQQIDDDRRKNSAHIDQRKALAKELGIDAGSDDYKHFVATGSFPAASTHAMNSKLYRDPATDKVFMGITDPNTGQIRNVDDGEIVKGALLTTAGSTAPKPIHYLGPDKKPLFGYMIGTKMFDQGGKELPPDTQVFSAWMEPQEISKVTWKERHNLDGSTDLVPVTSTETRTRGDQDKPASKVAAPPTDKPAPAQKPAPVKPKPSASTTPSDGSRSFGGKVPPQVAKAYDAYNGAQERYSVMQKALPEAQKGDQQAMLNLLANHIGMTMGLQKGSRITQAIYGEAEQSAPWLQRVKARFDKDGYLMGVVLTPEQMRQMISLAKVRLDEDKDAWQREIAAAKTGYGMDGKVLPPPPEAQSGAASDPLGIR